MVSTRSTGTTARQRLVRQRLIAQQLERPRFETPGALVHWLGAVQAQDYRGSLWALGLRLPGSTEADIEQAIADRAIVRTWPMRGTLHFVSPADVRWMLPLLTPRVIARSARRYQELELDNATLSGVRCRSHPSVSPPTIAAGRASVGRPGWDPHQPAHLGPGGAARAHHSSWARGTCDTTFAW